MHVAIVILEDIFMIHGFSREMQQWIQNMKPRKEKKSIGMCTMDIKMLRALLLLLLPYYK